MFQDWPIIFYRVQIGPPVHQRIALNTQRSQEARSCLCWMWWCVIVHKYDYDCLTKAGFHTMAAARISAARNTSWVSTWHLQEHEWDPELCPQLSQPPCCRRNIGWFLSPLKTQPFLQLSGPFKVSRDSSVNSTCFISNYMYFIANVTLIFLCLGDNRGFFLDS